MSGYIQTGVLITCTPCSTFLTYCHSLYSQAYTQDHVTKIKMMAGGFCATHKSEH